MDAQPERIGGCLILSKLGQGGMGAVFLARHETLGREVALKLLPPALTQNHEYVQRFLREARAAAQLRHPNIVAVFDAREEHGQYYIAMEFVDGVSLAAKLARDGPLPETEGLNYMVQAARGLAAAHALGLVHRDIKPENLLLGKDGVLKIADFGLVTAGTGDSALTQAGAMLGTPLYMSPEQGEGQHADARSDLYSLGVTFYRLFTGSAPFSAPTPIGVIYKHRYEATPNPQMLKPGLTNPTTLLILKLLAKQREERFQTAGEVAQAAEAALYQLTSGTALPHAPVAPASGLDAAYLPTMLPGAVAGAVVPSHFPSAPTMLPGAAAGAHPSHFASAPTMPPSAPPVYAAPTPVQTPLATPPVYAPPMPGQTPMSTPPVYAQPMPGQTPMAAPPYYAQPMPGQTPLGAPPYYAATPMAPLSAPTPMFTPAPAAPSGHGLAWALVAAVVLVLLAGGGYFGYLKYNEHQITQTLQKAQDLRTQRQYDAALVELDAARARYPDSPALRETRDSIEAASVRERVEKLKDAAREALDQQKYQAAADAYGQAQALLASKATLPGLDRDETLADRKKKAEDLRDFQRAMGDGAAAEQQGRFDEAIRAYREAEKFEARGDSVAAQAGQRVTFKGLVAEADRAEQSGNLAQALEVLGRAAGLKVEDVSARQDRLRKTLEYQRLTAEAAQLQKAGKPREAAASLEQAAALAPDAAAGEGLKGQAQQLVKDNDFSDALAAGKTALEQRRWADARKSLQAALDLRPGDQTAAGPLKKVLAGEQQEQGDAAFQKNDLAAAVQFYQAGLAADPENTTLAGAIKGLEDLRRLAEHARQAEAAGDWDGAAQDWQALAAQHPSDRATYEARANNARFEALMRKSRAAEQAGQLDQALAQAKAAQPYDSTGGQRAQAQIQSLEAKVQAQKQTAAVQGAVDRAMALLSQGQVRESLVIVSAAAQADPLNPQVAALKMALEGVDAADRGYARLENIRSDAQAALQNSANADDDKKIQGWLAQVRGLQASLAEARGAARTACLERRFDAIGPALGTLRAAAREHAQLYSGVAANFAGMAASAAKPKANIGGLVGGFGRRGGASFGASGDVGANQKKAAIFNATAQMLDTCAGAARQLGAE